jgi:hypothetical protein
MLSSVTESQISASVKPLWWPHTTIHNPSVNVFDDHAVLLRSIIWTLSIVLMFCNHNVSRDGSSLVIRWNLLCWVRSMVNRTMDKVQIPVRITTVHSLKELKPQTPHINDNGFWDWQVSSIQKYTTRFIAGLWSVFVLLICYYWLQLLLPVRFIICTATFSSVIQTWLL